MTADELRAVRAALGLSARTLGEVLGGTNPRTVRRWEAGDSPIPGSVALLLERLVADTGKDVAA